MALYSSNPIKTVIDDELEIASQHKNVEAIRFDDQTSIGGRSST